MLVAFTLFEAGFTRVLEADDSSHEYEDPLDKRKEVEAVEVVL